MKKLSLIILLVILYSLVSCSLKEGTSDKSVEPVTGNNKATITGNVVDHITSLPIANAIVKINSIDSQIGTITDNQGNFSIEIQIESTTNILVIALKDGYLPDSTTIVAAPGKSIQVPSLRLRQSGDIQIVSNEAASIYLLEQSTDKLSVKESGDIETALATFQVIDSTGIPISSSRSVEIEFSITSGPGGGEFIYPTKTKTDSKGQASVAITAGTKAGVIQIMAEIKLKNKVIRSKPIFFTIYGGLPVKERFGIASDKLNYSYWSKLNQIISFVALLGDKYSNPVKPNTAVYFETTEGVIGNFKYTDILGRASSQLVTFGFPNHPTYGPGFFVVTAKTVDENSEEISTSTLRLLSYYPIISNVNPTTFNIKNGGSQSFSFTVKDINGNPISSENKISFSVSGDLIASPSEILIPDALYGGPNITEFNVTISDSKPEEIKPKACSFVITITGPFGTYSYAPIIGYSE